MRQAAKTIPQYAVRESDRDVPYLPGTVKIGPFYFIVQEWSPREATLRGCMGETDLSGLVIRIRSDLPIQRQAETLMHEVMHGIWSVASIDHVIPGEENFVSAFSPVLFQVIRDNPMAFLTPALGH